MIPNNNNGNRAIGNYALQAGGPVGPVGIRGATGATGAIGATGPTGPGGYVPKPVYTRKIKPLPEDKEPEHYFINLIESFDLENPIHIHFKNLCESLAHKGLDNVLIEEQIHVDIKNIILNYAKSYDLEISDIYKMVLTEIYNNNLTDFKLNCGDQTIYCLKTIIKNMPCFSLMFEDTGMNLDTLDINEPYELMFTLIKLMYTHNTEIITVDNFIPILQLMDKFMMKEYFTIMLTYANRNITDITEKLISDQNFDHLKILHRILEDIKNETVNELHIPRGQEMFVGDIIKKMFSVNYGPHIFVFDKWPTLFSDQQKIQGITLTKKYDLLDISLIKPNIILAFLSEIDFSNDIYSNVINKFESGVQVFFGQHNLTKAYSDRVILITSYYPVFTCSIIVKLNGKIIDTVDNLVIQFLGSGLKMSVGNKILFSRSMSQIDLDNTYVIDSMTKNCNGKCINVEHAQYIPTLSNSVTYELGLDKIIMNYGFGISVYCVNDIAHTVCEYE
jgi:hypothetical protein